MYYSPVGSAVAPIRCRADCNKFIEEEAAAAEEEEEQEVSPDVHNLPPSS